MPRMGQPDVGNRWLSLWAQSGFPDAAGSVVGSAIEVSMWEWESSRGIPILDTLRHATYQNWSYRRKSVPITTTSFTVSICHQFVKTSCGVKKLTMFPSVRSLVRRAQNQSARAQQSRLDTAYASAYSHRPGRHIQWPIATYGGGEQFDAPRESLLDWNNMVIKTGK